MGVVVTRNQPQGAARIDATNPLARSLGAAYTFGDGGLLPRDHLGASHFDTITGALGQGTGQRGHWVGGDTGYGILSAPDTRNSNASGQYTYLMCVDYKSATGTYAGLFCKGTGNANQGSGGLQINDGNSWFIFHNDDGSAATLGGIASASAITGAGPTVIALSFNGSRLALFRDGVLSSSTTFSTPIYTGTSSRFILFGERAQSTSYATAGRCSWFLAFTRGLSDAEVASVSQNPWQIIVPQRRVWTAGIPPIYRRGLYLA